MTTCPKCEHSYTGDACPRCAAGVVSVADDTLDSMIQGASTPSLVTLFQRAKKAGVLGAVSNYGEGAPPVQ